MTLTFKPTKLRFLFTKNPNLKKDLFFFFGGGGGGAGLDGMSGAAGRVDGWTDK